MANPDIVGRILNLVSQAETRAITGTDFERGLLDYISALEAVPEATRRRLENYGPRVVKARLEDDEYPGEPLSAVLNALRTDLASLPQ